MAKFALGNIYYRESMFFALAHAYENECARNRRRHGLGGEAMVMQGHHTAHDSGLKRWV